MPAAARLPGRIKARAFTDRLTLTMDIFATACEALGVHPPAGIDAVSFWPTLLGQDAPQPDRDLYFVRREGGAAYGGLTIDAFRRGQWKLLQDSPFAPLELYDLQSDPQERTNLVARKLQVFDQLSAGLRQHIHLGGQTPWQPSPKSQP